MQTEHKRDGLATLSVAALGVVYGDIGTSPLYTMKEVFAGGHHPVPITPDNVLGILSLIFWSLIVVVTIKYVAFIMRADNKGEGGIMALMALAMRPTAEGSRKRSVILMLGLFGTALFYGDALITPAISVLSAVEGLEVVAPGLTPYVIPLTLIVLVVLFVMQRAGTASVGRLFGPVMGVWFVVLAGLGLYNILSHPAVLAALNPAHAFRFLADKPALGFFSLGAVVLAQTGAETLYADMGHFGRRPVQLAWLGLVLPALVLNYFGQGALLIADPSAIENPFYLLAPEALLLPMVVLATVATVIASQAVISGAFSMTQQVMQLGYSPRLEIQHTSQQAIGQIYLPGINWALLVAVIALVLGFGSSTKLAAAYGIAVTGTMAITTVLAFVVMRYLWQWKLPLAVLCALPFLCVDLAFFSANLVKVADGGWFPLVFGVGVFILLTTWKRGRQLLYERLSSDTLELDSFAASMQHEDVARVPGTAVFLTPAPDRVPHALLHSLKHYQVLHERVVIVTVEVHDVPYLPATQRAVVEPLPNDFWRVRIDYGFMDDPDLPAALASCSNQGLEFDLMRTSFFLGRETLIPRFGSELAFWREILFITMFRNAGSATSFFKLPANRVVELGSQIVL